MTTQLFSYDTGLSGGQNNKLIVGDAENVTKNGKDTVQIIYPPQVIMSNTKVKEFMRIPITTTLYPSKDTRVDTECNIIHLSDVIGGKRHNSTSRANILIWYNAQSQYQNKIAVLDFQTITITQSELLWLRGTPLTTSLVPNLCIAIRFKSEEFQYDMCLCDSHDGLSTRIAMNTKEKQRLRLENSVQILELINKIIAFREAGKFDDILISNSSTADTRNIGALIQQKEAGEPTESHLTTITDAELRKLVWTEVKTLFGKKGYEKNWVELQIADCLTHLRLIRSVDKCWDQQLCWMRPMFLARDFIRGKQYDVDFDGIWNLKDLTTSEFYRILLLVQKHERLLIFGEKQRPQYKLVHKDSDLPGGYSACGTQKKRLVRLIFVLDMNDEVIISCEKYTFGNEYFRLAHSQLAGGYPVKAAGELVLEQFHESNATKRWFFVEINNRSGHYSPPATSIFDEILIKLQKTLSMFFLSGLYVRKINTLAIGMPGRS